MTITASRRKPANRHAHHGPVMRWVCTCGNVVNWPSSICLVCGRGKP